MALPVEQRNQNALAKARADAAARMNPGQPATPPPTGTAYNPSRANTLVGRQFQNMSAGQTSSPFQNRKFVGTIPSDSSKTTPNNTGTTTAPTDTFGTQSQVVQTQEDKYQQAIDAYTRFLEGDKSRSAREAGEMVNARLATLDPSFDRAKEDAQRGFEAATENTATRFGFSGFGRSSNIAKAQTDLAREAARTQAMIDTTRALEEQKIRAEVLGASAEEIKGLNAAILQAKQSQANAIANFAKIQADIEASKIEAGQTIEQQALARQEVDKDLSKQMGTLVNKYGEAVLDGSGNAIPTPPNFDFGSSFKGGDGMQYVLRYNPQTGEAEAISTGVRVGGGSGGSGNNFGLTGQGFDLNKKDIYERVASLVANGSYDSYEAASEAMGIKGMNNFQLGAETAAYINSLPDQPLQPGVLDQVLDPTSLAAGMVNSPIGQLSNAIGDKFNLRSIPNFLFGPRQ